MSDFSLSQLPSFTPDVGDLAAQSPQLPSGFSNFVHGLGQDLSQRADINRLYGGTGFGGGLGGFGQSRMALPNVPNAPSSILPAQAMGRNRIAQQLAGLPTINDPSGGGGW